MSRHTSLCVTKTGLVISTEIPYLAASPDTLVQCDCCDLGVMEVKCPFAFREATVDTFLADPSSCVMVGEDAQPQLKPGHAYYCQAQLQMFACNAGYCDFTVYGERFILIVCVIRDTNFVQRHLEKVRMFILKATLPQMMAKVFAKQR